MEDQKNKKTPFFCVTQCPSPSRLQGNSKNGKIGLIRRCVAVIASCCRLWCKREEAFRGPLPTRSCYYKDMGHIENLASYRHLATVEVTVSRRRLWLIG